MRCDGYSDDEINRGIELSIITHGWYLLCVGPGAHAGGAHWAYTIGLDQSFGLPELVATDLVHPQGGRFLEWAATELSRGRSLDDLSVDGVAWRPVHDDHLMTGLVAGWEDYTRESPVMTRFVQLVPPFDAECPSCPSAMADLADPDEEFPGNRGVTLAS